MTVRQVVLVFLLFLSFNGISQEVVESTFGKGVLNRVAKDSTWSVKFGIRMQFLAIGEQEYNGESYDDIKSNFLIRRARLKFSGFAFSPKLKYKMELGLSNRDISGASAFTNNAPRYIIDAVVKWNFYKNMELWAGQTKLPGNRERVISSGNMQLVDRSLLNKRFNIDRDIGIQLRHYFNLSEKFMVKEMFSFAQGEGRNLTKGNLGGYQYTGRVELLPFGEFKSRGDYSGGDLKREATPKLAIGITYDYNNNAVKNRSNQGSYMETDEGFYKTNISTLFVDMMLKYKGFSFMGEYANRDADNPIAVNSNGIATGAVVQVGNALNLQTAYLFKNNWEVSTRYTTIGLDEEITGKAIEKQYTFGISKYIAGHKMKVQSDISYTTLGGNQNNLMYRLQFDVHL